MRSGRDLRFSVRLLPLIDEALCGLVECLAGNGRGRAGQGMVNRAAMCDEEAEPMTKIDSSDGWEFAFEGGAHILFRHNSAFVCSLRLCSDS
jgi:hypothetical protein